MSDNPSLSQTLQGAVESTLFTPLAATKRFRSFGIEVDPQTEVDEYFPNGNIFPSSAALTQEWTEAEVSGVLTFHEIVYLLTNAFGPATITTPGGGTLSRDWTWAIQPNSLLVPKGFTYEKGNSVYAVRLVGAVLNALNIGWKRTDRIEVGGSMLAKKLTIGHTMTAIGASPTVPLIRVLPQMVSVKTAATYAGLGAASVLTRCFEASIDLDGFFNPIWPLNASVDGHDGYVPVRPDSEVSLMLMANATGMGYLTNLRNGDTIYNRIQAIGPIIEAAIPYKVQIDISSQVKDVDKFDDSDGVYVIPYTFTPIDDGTNPSINIVVTNNITAL